MVSRVWAVAIAFILIVQIVVFGITIDNFPNAKAQDVPEEFKIPGRVEGTGTHFEVTDSLYLNVTLDSSEPITLTLESIPEMITMLIESNSTASSTIITLSGFSSNTTFHKYEDDYHNHVSFTADANGSYTWTQDISIKHFVFIQPRESTKFIKDDATGGDCTLIGTWNPANKTCKMTTNVSETIQIDSNGITLDGNGKFITGTGTGNGVFLPSKTGVTVKNLNVDLFGAGISLSSSSSNTITGNSVSRTGFGIFVFSSSNSNTITGNSVSDIDLNGMVVFASSGNTITGNTLSKAGPSQFGAGIIVQSASGNTVSSNSFSNTNVGIALASSSNSNTISGNTVSNTITGISLFSSNGNTITGNTVSNTFWFNGIGIFLRSSSNSNRIYNNNFIDNPTQARVDASSGNIFNIAAPTGGNYWSNFDTPAEGCNNLNGDNFCDAPFIFTGGQDNFPWTTRDGWKALPSISINDVTLTEGNAGTTNAVFTVALSNPSSQTITVGFATADGTATFSSDYFTASGTLVFLSGEVSKTISITVNADLLHEPDETFFVNLSSCLNCTIGDAEGIGTIINDDFPPVANANGPYQGNEGQNILLDASGSSDPDGTIATYEWDFDNDGLFDDATGVTPSSLFGDNGVFTIGLKVTDNSGLSATDNAQITVNNVNPTLNAGADATINEGDTFASGGSFTDPGTDSWTATVDYGDGTGAQPLALTDKTFSLSHTYADNGLYTVMVTVTDDDGGSGTDMVGVTVNNVKPSVSAGADAVINEGNTFASTGSFTDPGTDSWTATVDYGDGTGAQPLTLHPDKTFSLGHTYADDDADDMYAITVTVTDDDGGSGTDTAVVTVNNLSPVVGPITAPIDPVAVGTQVTASSAFTDPGTADTHTASVNWGDGTTSPATVTEAGGSGSATGSHTYSAAGVYTLTLTVCDDDGGCGQSIFQFVVIYDPNGGFVTGGGWIDSPPGAYTANPTLTGKATFGFVSKYLPGATTPSGNTEFQFKVANLNFHSHDYEWLVVAGAKAQYKGTGTINGAGNYGFMLTAIDAGVNDNDSHTMDKFRIKIWDNNNGLVYDNQLGASDDSEPTTEIKGGSIVIHKEQNT